MTQTLTVAADRALQSRASDSPAWWFLGTLAVLRNPQGAPRTPAVIELTVPPGGSPPAHIHDDLDDSFFLLEGEVVVRCGDRIEVASAGSYVALPQGVDHTFRVTSSVPAKMLLVHADDSFLRFIETVGTPTDDRRLPPEGTSVPASDDVVRACEATGARFVGPSLEAADLPPHLQQRHDETPPLGAVNHVSLHVADVTASEQWYANALDLVRVDGEVDDAGHGHVVMLNPDAGWLVTLAGPATPRVEHVAFTCPDRETLVRRQEGLARRGITPGDITDAPYGSGFVLRDPDGLEMELFTPAVG